MKSLSFFMGLNIFLSAFHCFSTSLASWGVMYLMIILHETWKEIEYMKVMIWEIESWHPCLQDFASTCKNFFCIGTLTPMLEDSKMNVDATRAKGDVKYSKNDILNLDAKNDAFRASLDPHNS